MPAEGPGLRIEAAQPLRVAEPHRAVTVLEDPGSSDIRYDATLMKWQFNWQTKNETGAKLRAGCYEISITANSTCAGQGEGPFLVQLD